MNSTQGVKPGQHLRLNKHVRVSGRFVWHLRGERAEVTQVQNRCTQPKEVHKHVPFIHVRFPGDGVDAVLPVTYFEVVKGAS